MQHLDDAEPNILPNHFDPIRIELCQQLIQALYTVVGSALCVFIATVIVILSATVRHAYTLCLFIRFCVAIFVFVVVA